MKNFDLNSLGVHEMNALEMQETDGGIIGLILVAAALLLTASSCINGPVNIQIGGSHNTINPSTGGTVSADSSKLEIPLDVPIGY